MRVTTTVVVVAFLPWKIWVPRVVMTTTTRGAREGVPLPGQGGASPLGPAGDEAKKQNSQLLQAGPPKKRFCKGPPRATPAPARHAVRA